MSCTVIIAVIVAVAYIGYRWITKSSGGNSSQSYSPKSPSDIPRRPASDGFGIEDLADAVKDIQEAAGVLPRKTPNKKVDSGFDLDRAASAVETLSDAVKDAKEAAVGLPRKSPGRKKVDSGFDMEKAASVVETLSDAVKDVKEASGILPRKSPARKKAGTSSRSEKLSNAIKESKLDAVLPKKRRPRAAKKDE